MGDNYYHRFGECQHCNRYDQRHIGKASYGWEFSFQGFEDDENRRFLVSWAEWKTELQKGGRIFDEYDREIPFDDFVRMVEETKGKKNHYDWCRAHQGELGVDLRTEWKDAEGWSFTTARFC
jgi:hypothetical protein